MTDRTDLSDAKILLEDRAGFTVYNHGTVLQVTDGNEINETIELVDNSVETSAVNKLLAKRKLGADGYAAKSESQKAKSPAE